MTKQELLRTITMNTIAKKTQDFKDEFSCFFEEGFNKFFKPRRRQEWIMNCLGYDCEQISEDVYRFKLVVNGNIDSKYLINDTNFKFSKVNLKIPNSPSRKTFNQVTFNMDVGDVIFYGMHECESALNYFNEYLTKTILMVDNKK